jgi:hypothetical protein
LAARAYARTRLVARADDTVRTLRQRLARTAEDLREVGSGAVAADEAVQRVAGLLRLQLPPQPVKGLLRLAEFVDQLAQLQTVRPSWWDPARRQEARKAITRCSEEAGAAQALRLELMARLSPQAFAPESAVLAAEASPFRSFLARLWPRWWNLKARLAAWYTGPVPPAAGLLADMGRLAEYHRRADFCRQVQLQYAADMLLTPAGSPTGRVRWRR